MNMGMSEDPQWEEIARFWGTAYTFSNDPGQFPDQPCAAHRIDGNGTVRAASAADLLDAIKDDAAARPFKAIERPTADGAEHPGPVGEREHA